MPLPITSPTRSPSVATMSCLSWLCGGKKLPEKELLTIIVVGLDNAGKSTLVSSFQRELDPHIVPTIGFNKPAILERSDCRLRVYDVGGGPRIRGVWANYYPEVHGVVYVVDSADEAQIAESKRVFAEMLENDYVKGKPIAIMANKQDLPAALPEADVSIQLGIDTLGVAHTVAQCIANPSMNGGKFDDRIFSALDWLVKAIQADLVALRPRVVQETEQAEQARKERKAKQRADNAARRAAREAKAAGEDAEAKPEAKAPEKEAAEEEDEVIRCDVCKTRPATSRAAVSKWMPVCDPCKEALIAGKKPPVPGAEPEAAAEPAADGAGDAAADAATAGAGAGAGAGAAAAAAGDAAEGAAGAAGEGAAAAGAATEAAEGAAAAVADAPDGAAVAEEAPKPHLLAMSNDDEEKAKEAAEAAAAAAAEANMTLPGGLADTGEQRV